MLKIVEVKIIFLFEFIPKARYEFTNLRFRLRIITNKLFVYSYRFVIRKVI